MSKIERESNAPTVARRGTGAPTFDPSLVDLLVAVSEGSAESMALIDGEGTPHLVRGGQPLAGLLGLTPEAALVGWPALLGEHDRIKLERSYRRAKSRPGATDTVAVACVGEEGSPLHLEVSLSNRLDDPAVRALVLRVREAVAPQTRPPDSVESPTSGGGLVEPQRFRELLQRAVERKEAKIWSRDRFARSALKDRRYDFSLLRIELDQVRAILGAHGEEVTTRVLAAVTEQLLSVLRGRDVLAHVGGGEFAILLDGVGDVEQAERVTDVILNVLDRRIEVAGHAVATAPIIGIATSERRYVRADEVMRDAAAASVRARRRRGRKRVAFQTNMRAEDQRRIRLMADMPDGLERNEFYLCYQPIVAVEGGALLGFEALARWRHAEHGEVSPAVFIPLAEETGFITKLGTWVLEQACRQMAAWRGLDPSLEPLVISVNLSATQLMDQSLLRTVEKALGATGLPPECLDLEVTESVVIEETESAAAQVARLKLYGVTFSLDDFGTGYSSLSYLHRMDYDALKIDRSFVGQSTAVQREVVRSIVTLAHALGMRVVGEGVESQRELDALREIGCDAAQGYFFARPLSPHDAEAVIRAGIARA